MDIIHTFLHEQGLNETDTQLYLTLYQHGMAHASTLAARTEIDRTTVYSALKRLLKKGIIAETTSAGVRAYVAIAPDVFLDKLSYEEERLKARKKHAQNFISSMEQLQQAELKKHQISIFEGARSIMSLYHTTLQAGTQKSFLTISEIPEDLRTFLTKTYMQKKLEKKVFSKVLLADSPAAQRYQQLDDQGNRESRLVKKLPFELYSEVILFDEGKVAIIDFSHHIYGMLIESQTFYKTLESMFDYVWEMEGNE